MDKKTTRILVLVIGIVGLIAVVMVLGGIFLFKNSSPPQGNIDPNKTVKQAADFKALIDKAPQGASPSWTKGDPAAKVTLEEFADFSCPTCGQFHQTLKEIEKTYGQKVRIIYRHNPLNIKGHENSYNASRAAEAAGLQGRFWEMQNMLFTNQKTWTVQSESDARNTFADYAKSIGIDVEKFKDESINNQVVNARVASDMNRGKAININSTPTVIINGYRFLTFDEISKPDALRQAIESEMQKAGAPAQSNANSNSNQNAQ